MSLIAGSSAVHVFAEPSTIEVAVEHHSTGSPTIVTRRITYFNRETGNAYLFSDRVDLSASKYMKRTLLRARLYSCFDQTPYESNAEFDRQAPQSERDSVVTAAFLRVMPKIGFGHEAEIRIESGSGIVFVSIGRLMKSGKGHDLTSITLRFAGREREMWIRAQSSDREMANEIVLAFSLLREKVGVPERVKEELRKSALFEIRLARKSMSQSVRRL